MKKIEKNWAEKSKVTAFDRFDDVYQKFDFTNVKSRTLGGETVLFEAANEVVLHCSKIKANAEVQINRFTFVHPLQQFDDFSYAIDKKNITQDFSDKNYDCVNKNNGNIVLKNLQLSDYQSITTILNGTIDVQISIPINENDAFFGLGDKTGNLNLRGSYYSNWCTDAFAADKKSNELYRAIPFFAAQTNDAAYGIFFDNTFRSYFDFGKTNPNVLTFGAEGGIMDFYVIQAPDLLQVIQNYTRLTGTPTLPPIWALGYHQCRWSYFPENRVKEVAQTFRDLKIPCDSIYLDIDYMDKYQCFTINKTYFPDLKRLVTDLKKSNFETVVMIDCGIFINKNYKVYIDGVKENVFLKRGNGELAIAPVWPEKCVFPDYTNTKIREWWSNLHQEFCKDLEISGFWNDMNEPAVFNVKAMSFLEDLQHDFDGKPCNHAKAHNIYGMQMSRSSLEGMKKFQPKKRPFLLTRATFSGGQRYASIWTGDNVSDWEGLRLANLQVQRISASGFSFTGSDIGGFAGRPDGELMVRWLQLAVFHPLMRTHSMGNHADGAAAVDEEQVKLASIIDRADQEPWSFGEPFTDAARKAIELRYQLLPYLYNAFFDYISNKTPIVQSRFLREKTQINHERDFYFGENLLVSPILKAATKTQKIELPEGDWYDFYKGKKYNGNIKFVVKEDEIPLFVRAGTLLPIAPIRQSTKEKIDVMNLHFYYGENAFYEQTTYEDDGETANPKENKSLQKYFSIEKKQDKIIITQSLSGFYKTTYNKYNFNVFGLKNKIAKIEIEENGEWEMPIYQEQALLVSATFSRLSIFLK